MAYQQKPNRGSMFKNDKKDLQKAKRQDTEGQKEANKPDYNGNALIGGVEYWVKGWINRPEGKEPFMSLAFEQKENQPASARKDGELQGGFFEEQVAEDLPF